MQDIIKLTVPIWLYVKGKAFNSGDMITGSWMTMETDNKLLTQDIERLKLAASQSTLGRILLNEENKNSGNSDHGSGVHGSFKDGVYGQHLDGELLSIVLNEGTIIVWSLYLV